MLKLILVGGVLGIFLLIFAAAVLLVKIYKKDKHEIGQNSNNGNSNLQTKTEKRGTLKSLLPAFFVMIIGLGMALLTVGFMKMRGSGIIKFLIYAGGGCGSGLMFLISLECYENMQKKGKVFLSYIFSMVGMFVLAGLMFGLVYSIWKYRLWDFWYNIFSPMAGLASSIIFVSSYPVYKYMEKRSKRVKK